MSLQLLSTSFFLCFAFTLFSQNMPVSWSIDTSIEEDKLAVVIQADIEKTWKIYSRVTEEGGPIPTSIEFMHGADIVLDGDYSEADKPVVKESELFMMNVATFSDEATFVQPIADYKAGETIKAIVTFMCCSGNQCLPPTDVELEVTL